MSLFMSVVASYSNNFIMVTYLVLPPYKVYNIFSINLD